MRVVDSHTEGEPTRVIIDGGPDLGSGTIAERAARLASDHRDFCASVLCEPRGHDAMVGALLVPTSEPGCATGVIYFNTLENLGMCGHATIGLGVTLVQQGLITPGPHRIDTPVGVVGLEIHDANTVSVENVRSFRLHKGVCVQVDGLGDVTGDVAWGGNWFFLTHDVPVPLEAANIRPLTDLTIAIRKALEEAGITGTHGAWINHVELSGPARAEGANSRNFVLCPSGSYDRSPCGTGSSAKMACLAEDGEWPAEREWVQESVIGSTYRMRYVEAAEGGIMPTITGSAFVTAEARLLFDPNDPYASGIRA
jgi:proline racemase